MSYELVIGLEVHAQLQTKSKLFCSCATTFGAIANENTCEICLGLPGVLPVLNQEAVSLAVKAALALNCEIHSKSIWARKNYFYPDLSKGYQISQYEFPYCSKGQLGIHVNGKEQFIDITRIHIEEDAGKTIHDTLHIRNRSCVDFNRGGMPLVEIVTEPCLRSSVEASVFVRSLRQILRYTGVCDGNMEQGSLRCDANVSIRPIGQKEYGTRTEIKNINSFKNIQLAIDYEFMRQIQLVESGEIVIQETRLWDAQEKKTRSMRSKEEAHDYRYFPEPDLPHLDIESSLIEEQKKQLPELPIVRTRRFIQYLSLTEQAALVLTEDKEVADFFEEANAIHNNPQLIANWVINEVLKETKGKSLRDLKISARHIGELVSFIDRNEISGKMGKSIFSEMLDSGSMPSEIIKTKGLSQMADVSILQSSVEEVLREYPEQVQEYKAGKEPLIGFFVGQVMKNAL